MEEGSDFMENQIDEAIELLRENGYVVKKITESMQRDSDKCEQAEEEQDCLGCACSICIMQ